MHFHMIYLFSMHLKMCAQAFACVRLDSEWAVLPSVVFYCLTCAVGEAEEGKFTGKKRWK